MLQNQRLPAESDQTEEAAAEFLCSLRDRHPGLHEFDSPQRHQEEGILNRRQQRKAATNFLGRLPAC
jgi:hypothetical protein